MSVPSASSGRPRSAPAAYRRAAATAAEGTDQRFADGSFQLDGIGPGLASVFSLAAGYHARVASRIEILPTSDPAPLAIALEPLAAGEEPKLVIAGIGAELVAEGEALVVRRVVPGGGAAEVGLVPGDGILAVDGRAVTDLGFSGAIQLIRGPEGTVVRLRVRRAAATFDLDVPRRLVRTQAR